MTIELNTYSGEQVEELNNSLPSPAAVESQDQYNPLETQQAAPVEAPKPSDQELNFRALAEKVDSLKVERERERSEHQLQLQMMQANLSQLQQAQTGRKNFLDGMQDNDIPNAGELRRAFEEREGQYQARIEELQFAQHHPDYADVLNKQATKLAQTDPLFIEGLKSASNKAQFAYSYAKKEMELQQLRDAVRAQSAPKVSETAQRIVQNASKPGTLSQTGGQTVLSKADYYASMSDKDFHALAAKHLEQI